jgi:hypothetical protein
MARVIHAQLTPEAREAIRRGDGKVNRAGRTLREWLARSFETVASSRAQQGSLFGEAISVDDDVPLLLEALAQVTERTPDDLVEAWALEGPRSLKDQHQSVSPVQSAQLPDDIRGKVSELLDLAETLFDETVADGKRRLGGYSAADEASKSAREIYRALRKILDLPSE